MLWDIVSGIIELEGRYVELASATIDDVEDYREALICAGCQPAIVAIKLTLMRRFYDAAMRAGLRQDNPAPSVRGPRAKCSTARTPIPEIIHDVCQKSAERMTEVLVPGRGEFPSVPSTSASPARIYHPLPGRQSRPRQHAHWPKDP